MKWIVVPAVVLVGVAGLVQTAHGQPRTGCWHYTDGSSVFSTVCFTGSTGGNFNIEYALEDPDQGLVKGSCNGTLEITSLDDRGVVFTVPYQEDACRQEDQIFRVAQRDYACEWADNSMVCELTVYYDDGTVYSRSSGLEYSR